MLNESPIGVFDSGVGGLSVFSELVKLLPNENYIYFGDTKNLPYGNKSKEELVEITRKIFDFFNKQGVKAVVMACNTTSALTYDVLKNDYNFKIYPIVQTVSKTIAQQNINKIGVFATVGTINSHAYKNEIYKYNQNSNVYEIACPEWVKIVENELFNDKESIENVKMHLDEMLENDVEKIILGCTHYPYLLDVLAKFMDRDLFINPAKSFAEFISNDLENSKLLNSKSKKAPEFFVSSNANQFISAAKLFYDVKTATEIKL